MGRAENRRKKKQEESDRKKLNSVLKKNGFPEFQMPAAPLRMTNLTTQEVANATGAKIAVLEQWKKEQTEEIKKALMIEAQEKLDRAENYITLCNVITTLKSLEGFRYGKAAANYLLEHYSENVVTSERGNIRKTYEELHEKWGLEIEFEEPDLNKELGFDVVDWRTEYIGKHIPLSVYEKIWNDSNNIATVMMQVAVLLELCEEFGFHKHKNTQGMPMMDKFLKGLKEKYKKMDRTECGTMEGIEELKQKYGIEVAWSKRIQETMNWFKF